MMSPKPSSVTGPLSSAMAVPKILVIPGSLRAKSYNVRLAALARLLA
jgi:hypothetical protein